MNPDQEGPLPRRVLGKTGREVSLFGLGGEGVLRTQGRSSEAVAVVHRALDEGVRYCDTAPAYSSSQDDYGAAPGERRDGIFLASKTADRTRDGSLRLLDDSLNRIRTDHLDRIFAKGGRSKP
jgi:aryl-alcohol dehydrogenase-like predicted oxidoreductase